MSAAIDSSKTVGELVAERISRSRVFEKYGIDYCCGGDTPFAEACAAGGADPAAVAAELSEAEGVQLAGETDYKSIPLSRLCDEIEATHHAYMKRELPRLSDLLDKTQKAHGENHPELAEVCRVFRGLRMEIEAHLMKEERILFPMIRQIEVAAEMPRFHCGSMSGPVSVMEMEHDSAGEALRRMSELTGGYEAPADACNTYRAALDGLREMEGDLHLHIHKENNILFPRALMAEQELCARA